MMPEDILHTLPRKQTDIQLLLDTSLLDSLSFLQVCSIIAVDVFFFFFFKYKNPKEEKNEIKPKH